MTCTQAPDPCSQNRAVKAPMSARAVTAAQLNTGHHLSTRVPCHPVWPRPVARLRGLVHSCYLVRPVAKIILGSVAANNKSGHYYRLRVDSGTESPIAQLKGFR